MEIQHLRYFCTVAKTGSFTRAADELNVSQPSLSEGLKKLEAGLGVVLFERLGRGVRLTPQGEAFRPHAQQILHSVWEARRSVEPRLSKTPTGKLIVGCIPTILPYLIAPAIARFAEQHPHVEIVLQEDLTARLVEGLQGGALDLAIVGLPVRNPDLLCGEILREPLLLAASAGSRWAGRAEIHLRELEGERVLMLKEGHCFREDAMSVCRRAKFLIAPAFEGDHLSSIIRLAASGFGVGIIPAMAASTAPDCALIPVAPQGERRVGYIKLRRHAATPAEKAFIQWLRQLAK